MDYSIALGNGMNPSTPLNGCEINVRFCFCLIYKSSYVLRSVLVHWMYQNFHIGSFFNVQLIIHCLNSFLSCSITNLTLASLSRLFTIKIDVLPFLQVLIPTVVFSYESNY